MKKQRFGIWEQGSENRHQEAEVKNREEVGVEELLKRAMPRLDGEPEPDRDLWPAMLNRMDSENAGSAARVPWFDWALAGGLLAFAAVVPRTIPVILYYL